MFWISLIFILLFPTAVFAQCHEEFTVESEDPVIVCRDVEDLNAVEFQCDPLTLTVHAYRSVLVPHEFVDLYVNNYRYLTYADADGNIVFTGDVVYEILAVTGHEMVFRFVDSLGEFHEFEMVVEIPPCC